jgi:hypothetical protein
MMAAPRRPPNTINIIPTRVFAAIFQKVSMARPSRSGRTPNH